MHFDTHILFEDVQAFPGVSFPVTFRAKVEVEGLTAWLIHGVELPSDAAAHEWVELLPTHPLFRTLKGIACNQRVRVAEEARRAWLDAERNRELDEANQALRLQADRMAEAAA